MIQRRLTAGLPYPLGATTYSDGVNFAAFSQHASSVTLCLCDEDGVETDRVDLTEREGHVWHGFVAGLQAGQKYGYRVDGPYAPKDGHRFNAHKFLIDPYAKQLTGHLAWDDSLYGYKVGHKDADLSFDTRDSAPFMPRSVVVDDLALRGLSARRALRRPWSETIIYEAHVKGLTAGRNDIAHRGTFAGLSSDAILEHLTRLGVTAIELLPVQAFVDDRFLVERGLRNYWGYMTYGFFAPDPRYVSGPDVREFRQTVDRLHSAGIEVILDVVYNHTAEGDQNGPTLCFRGFDNASYYRLAENKRYYADTTGCGNSLNMDHPFVLRLVMDSLRYWVEVMKVDGFRFDLASTLARTGGVFDRDGPFCRAVRQDPVLNQVKLIAEPWDTGEGGYQLGAFPAPFAEWNDKYRDAVRSYWRGDDVTARKLARRVSGSAMQFDHDGRRTWASINFLTSHDGFTLEDVVSYSEKHNAANGEDNRDGHDHNYSDNCGVEGPTTDANVRACRAARKRNMFATLMLSQGTPMILAGDEFGNSQSGNNNAYAQDNTLGWVDWDNADTEFLAFCTKAISFRATHQILTQHRFLHAQTRKIDGVPDLLWRREDGAEMSEEDWIDPSLHFLGVEMRIAQGTPQFLPHAGALYMVFNAGPRAMATLPEASEWQIWKRVFETEVSGETNEIAAQSVVAFQLVDATA